MDDFRIDGPSRSGIEFRTPDLNSIGNGNPSFGDLIEDLIGSTNVAQLEAQTKAVDYARGEAGIVETVLALDKADLSLRLLLEVRNKVLEAYKEITRAI